MKILKFGGKSLDNGLGLQKCIEIITAKKKSGEKFAVVVSARGNTTDVLLELLEDAKNNTWSEVKWQQFKDFQTAPLTENILQEDFAQLEKYFNGVKLLQEASPKTIASFCDVLALYPIAVEYKPLDVAPKPKAVAPVFEALALVPNAKVLLEDETELKPIATELSPLAFAEEPRANASLALVLA